MALKFHEPRTLTATYRIVTPLFLGDAEQKATGISPASVKGALRFWWRALMWGKIRADLPDDAAALQCLHCQEGALFGSSADQGNAAAFTLRVTPYTKPANITTPPKAGIQYLLGQGLYHFNNGYLRPALSDNGTFDVTLHIHPKLEKQSQENYQEQQTQLVNTLMLFGLLGGLGSRARKGFGSLSIESLTHNSIAVELPNNSAELKQWLTGCQSTAAKPPFTAFSAETRLDISLQGKNPLDILNNAGEEQQLYRSYGRNGKVNSKQAEQNFIHDHDLVADVITNRTSPATIPHRSIFGLPHNYFFSSTKGKADFAPTANERSRRASPLFIHVHQFPDKQVALIQTLFPATFLPDRDPLEFKMGNRLNDKVSIRFNEDRMIDWQVIHAYMDRFTTRERVL
jgi:CRISPR-associated protein Cmr1